MLLIRLEYQIAHMCLNMIDFKDSPQSVALTGAAAGPKTGQGLPATARCTLTFSRAPFSARAAGQMFPGQKPGLIGFPWIR